MAGRSKTKGSRKGFRERSKSAGTDSTVQTDCADPQLRVLRSRTTSEQPAEDKPSPTTSKSKKGTSGKKCSRKKPAAEIAQSATEGSSMIVNPAPVVTSAQVAPPAITRTAPEADATQTTLLTAEGFGRFLADMGAITPSPNNTQERNVDEFSNPRLSAQLSSSARGCYPITILRHWTLLFSHVYPPHGSSTSS
ncbi:hypothetical protein BC834DRAFT_841287 [Gloeopeniophorella convolvens]|nr:hypothetical protein BC834DRAFT_841287 [Gloeopeniophorella convolvens]